MIDEVALTVVPRGDRGDTIHVIALQGDDRDYAWVLGPEDRVQSYKNQILTVVRDTIDHAAPGSTMTVYDALVHLAQDDVQGLEVPPVVRYSALAVIQEYFGAAGKRWGGARVKVV